MNPGIPFPINFNPVPLHPEKERKIMDFLKPYFLNIRNLIYISYNPEILYK